MLLTYEEKEKIILDLIKENSDANIKDYLELVKEVETIMESNKTAA